MMTISIELVNKAIIERYTEEMIAWVLSTVRPLYHHQQLVTSRVALQVESTLGLESK